jgi:LAO/AO transport system kinase
VSKAAPGKPADLAEAVAAGDRRALAQAITLVESTRAEDRPAADALLEKLLPRTGKSIRIGISGAPGVGKSAFIQAFGLHVLEQGHRLAVLAVDPSSRIGGGSILGDKTRMADLASDQRAFIRPSPAGITLGGVARRSREALLLCEASGHDVVLVETVGVGQSETAVADMTDMFLLLLQPGGGDELQGIKRGIVELADLLLVNKADGDMLEAAGRTAGDYQHALRLLRPATFGWQPEVLLCSALTGAGIPEAWQKVEAFRKTVGKKAVAERRARQARAWLKAELADSLMEALARHPDLAKQLPALEARVAAGSATPGAAARALLAGFLGRK